MCIQSCQFRLKVRRPNEGLVVVEEIRRHRPVEFVARYERHAERQVIEVGNINPAVFLGRNMASRQAKVRKQVNLQDMRRVWGEFVERGTAGRLPTPYNFRLITWRHTEHFQRVLEEGKSMELPANIHFRPYFFPGEVET